MEYVALDLLSISRMKRAVDMILVERLFVQIESMMSAAQSMSLSIMMDLS